MKILDLFRRKNAEIQVEQEPKRWRAFEQLDYVRDTLNTGIGRKLNYLGVEMTLTAFFPNIHPANIFSDSDSSYLSIICEYVDKNGVIREHSFVVPDLERVLMLEGGDK